MSQKKDERIRQVNLLQRILTRPELGSIFGLIIIVATFMFLTGPFNEWTGERNTFGPMFLNPIGIQGWVELAAFVGILAIGAALLMIAGEFDLSIGANIALSGHVFALLLLWEGVPIIGGFNIPFALLITFAFLAGIGAFMGYLVVRTGLPSFIVTLGFWFASRGLAVFMGQTFQQQSRLSQHPPPSQHPPQNHLSATNFLVSKRKRSVLRTSSTNALWKKPTRQVFRDQRQIPLASLLKSLVNQ